MAELGYLVELDRIQLDDAEAMTSWIQAIPLGKYDHPVYGEIDFDAEKIQMAAEHVANNTRGTDLDIDYDHKSNGGEAAGWIKQAEARNDGLWVMVEWTKKAWQHIQNKEYKYFSPEFADEWKHPKTGQVVKNILFGGGITNRPFLKDILPLNMSELSMPTELKKKEGNRMDPEKLRELLGLPKDATDEQVEAKLKEQSSSETGSGGTSEGGSGANSSESEGGGEGSENANLDPEVVAAMEGMTPEVIKLAESNPAIKALMDTVTALGKKLGTTQTALRLSEVNNQVAKLTEAGENGKALPATAAESLKAALLSDDAAASRDSFLKVLGEIQKNGLVDVEEHGGGGGAGGGTDGQSPTKLFNDKVQEIIEKDKLSYGDAVERAASLHEDLYEAHRQGSYAFREN